MIAVLLPAARVAAGRLEMAVGARADPDLLVRRRDRESADAAQLVGVADPLAVGADVGEAVAVADAADSGTSSLTQTRPRGVSATAAPRPPSPTRVTAAPLFAGLARAAPAFNWLASTPLLFERLARAAQLGRRPERWSSMRDRRRRPVGGSRTGAGPAGAADRRSAAARLAGSAASAAAASAAPAPGVGDR